MLSHGKVTLFSRREEHQEGNVFSQSMFFQLSIQFMWFVALDRRCLTINLKEVCSAEGNMLHMLSVLLKVRDAPYLTNRSLVLRLISCICIAGIWLICSDFYMYLPYLGHRLARYLAKRHSAYVCDRFLSEIISSNVEKLTCLNSPAQWDRSLPSHRSHE